MKRARESVEKNGEAIQTLTNTPNNSTNNNNSSFFTYFFAAIIFCGVASNMFLGGRVKNMMKMEIPKASAWKTASAEESRAKAEEYRASYQNYQKKTSQQQQQQQQHSQHHQEGYSSSIPPQFTSINELLKTNHLHTMGLTRKDFNEKIIKATYRDLVMKYHPDRLAKEDAHREEYRQKFQAITHSYQTLLDILKEEEERTSPK